MVYREDVDLEFLGQMESSDLNDLVLSLTRDRDGAERMTGELLKSELYKKYQPDHHHYWQRIRQRRPRDREETGRCDGNCLL